MSTTSAPPSRPQIEAGRPYRIKVTHFGDQVRATADEAPRGERVLRAVVAVVRGHGLADLCAGAGAVVVATGAELPDAIRRAHAREVVLLPNDATLRETAASAADHARSEGVRVALIPTRSAVQGIAALAVHEPARRFDEDVVAMTSAAGATRYAELAVAERESWTSMRHLPGRRHPRPHRRRRRRHRRQPRRDRHDRPGPHARRRMAKWSPSSSAPAAPDDLTERLEAHVRDGYLAVDTVVYGGGEPGCPLLIGVE